MAGERRNGFRFLSFFRCCSKQPLELEKAAPVLERPEVSPSADISGAAEDFESEAAGGPSGPETEGQLNDASLNHEPSTADAAAAVPETAGPWNDTPSLERSDEPNEASVREPPESAVSAVDPRRGRSTWKGKGKGGYQDGYGASRSRAASLDSWRGRGQCHYGFHCTRVDCWFQHPDGRAIDGRAASVDRGKARGKGHCFDGFECTRSICRFEHPTGRRRDLMPATGGQRESSRHRSVSRDHEELVARMDLDPDYCKQLKDGMLYHLSFFLRRYQLFGRISEQQLELFSRSTWQRLDLNTLQEEIQIELARLSSLRVELTEQILVPETLLPRFMGPEGVHLQFLRRSLGVEILVEPQPASELRALRALRLCGPPDVLEHARSALENHLISFSSTQQPFAEVEQSILQERSQTVHVFVDNSNICIGCQLLPNGFRDFQQRISIRGFTSMVQGVRKLSRRVVMGSRPSSQRFWAAWKREGYEVCTAHRDPRTKREEFVDGRLVGEALMHVLQPVGSGSHVLVLATGDGNLEGQAPNTAGANFQNLVRTIASRVEGWTVEVWCWRSSCHSCYKRMARAGEIRLYFLDGLRKEVTMTAGKTAPALAGSAVPNEGLEHEDTCVQCLMAEATYAFNPCNHRILCRECAMETRPHWNTRPLGLCFLCRCPWDDITASDTIAI